MVVLHVFRDSESDAEEWVGQKWHCKGEVSIEQPLTKNCIHGRVN